jgi:RNA polymerase sigma-70 factor (ECF subfamily)
MTQEPHPDPVPLARDGDLDAFEELVRLHTPAAYRVAVAVVGESLARDLVQEAVLTAWQQLPRLRDAGRFAPWLHRIVVSRGRSMLRHSHPVREIPVSPWHGAALLHAHDDMGAEEARAVLTTTFAALAFDQRAVIALHYAAGLSLREVADALDVSRGTATSRLAAALEALRHRAGIGEDGTDGGMGSGQASATDERMPPQDPRVEAFVESLADVGVPSDLAASVSTHVRESPGRGRSFRLPLLLAAAGLLLTVSVAMAAGWQPPFDLLPGPQATTPAPTPSPTASPTGSATPETSTVFEFARVAAATADVARTR